jgi:hypothetical protein
MSSSHKTRSDASAALFRCESSDSVVAVPLLDAAAVEISEENDNGATALTQKDLAWNCSSVVVEVYNDEDDDDDDTLRLVPFLEIHHSPVVKKRRLGRNKNNSQAESFYSQAPSESTSLRLLQWSCLFPREISFETPLSSSVIGTDNNKSLELSFPTNWLPGELLLLDPTEPLVYGRLKDHQDPILVHAAHLFQVLLEQHCYSWISRENEDEEDIVDVAQLDETLECMLELIRVCPCVAQVQYLLPTEFCMDKNDCFCFPLVHFCVSGCLAGIEACYEAYPEAIGCAVSGWLPLHFAAGLSNQPAVVQFLLHKFPNAARRTHVRTHQTALHIACQRRKIGSKSSVVRTLMHQYPTALQLADRQGWTPVHHLCACPFTDVYLLQTMIEASPTTISAATRQLELPLHILCRHGSCRTDSIQYLLDSVHADSWQAWATDLDQNTLFHCAASNPLVTADAVRLLLARRRRDRNESLLSSKNMDGDTAYEIAKLSLKGEHKADILCLLACRD